MRVLINLLISFSFGFKINGWMFKSIKGYNRRCSIPYSSGSDIRYGENSAYEKFCSVCEGAMTFGNAKCSTRALIIPRHIQNGVTAIPQIRIESLYTQYRLHNFDINKNYIGVAIFAIKHRGNWFTSHNTPFTVHRPTDDYGRRRSTVSRIRPGYIIMAEEQKIRYSKGDTPHQKLFSYFFDKTLEQFQNEGTEFVSIGFSYQARHSQTNAQLCDFKFKSSTFNEGLFTTNLQSYRGIDGTTRTSDRNSVSLIRLALYNFQQTGNRIMKIQDVSDVSNTYERLAGVSLC